MVNISKLQVGLGFGNCRLTGFVFYWGERVFSNVKCKMYPSSLHYAATRNVKLWKRKERKKLRKYLHFVKRDWRLVIGIS